MKLHAPLRRSHAEYASAPEARPARLASAAFSLPALQVITVAGCTPEEIAPFGKFLFAFMALFFLVTPLVFYLKWRRRKRD